MGLEEVTKFFGETFHTRQGTSNRGMQTCQLQKFKIGRLWFSTVWKLGDFNQNREIL